MTTEPGFQILRVRDVRRVTGLCRSLVYQLESQQRFPKRIKLTERSVGWLEAEVQAWLAARVQESRGTSRT
jgi:prophage regulatory protein